MILRVGIVVKQVFNDYAGGAIAHLTACDVAVFNMCDRGFSVMGGEVVDDNLAVRAELGCEG